MKLIGVGYQVKEKMNKQMKELADKERWSMAKLSVVAMEYYLKLRGYEIKEGV